MEIVPPSQDLESWLKPLMSSSVKALSVVQIGQKLNIPGLEIRVPPKKEDGSRSKVFIATLEDETEPDDVVVFCENREEEIKEIKSLLETHLDWSVPHMFGGIPEHLLPTMEELCKIHGTAADSTPADIYYLPSLSYLRFDINGALDNDIRVGPLGVSNVDAVVATWKFAKPVTRERMRLMFNAGHCFGVFGKRQGELRSWVCTMRHGGVGILYTPPEFRRRGYSKICIAAISRHLFSIGINPYAYIEDYNKVSAKIFREMGFLFAEKSDWLYFKPHVDKSSK